MEAMQVETIFPPTLASRSQHALEFQIDGVEFTVEVSARTVVADPAIARDMADRLAEAIEEAVLALRTNFTQPDSARVLEFVLPPR